MSIEIINQSITECESDVIVCSAKLYSEPHYGLSGDIYQKAGFKELTNAYSKVPYKGFGSLNITPGFNLDCEYIIHVVSPLYHDGKSGEKEMLELCYIKALNLATACDCYNISFPLICAGEYEFPIKEAWQIVLSTVIDYVNSKDFEINIVFCVIDEEIYKIGKEVLRSMLNDKSLVKKHRDLNYSIINKYIDNFRKKDIYH